MRIVWIVWVFWIVWPPQSFSFWAAKTPWLLHSLAKPHPDPTKMGENPLIPRSRASPSGIFHTSSRLKFSSTKQILLTPRDPRIGAILIRICSSNPWNCGVSHFSKWESEPGSMTAPAGLVLQTCSGIHEPLAPKISNKCHRGLGCFLIFYFFHRRKTSGWVFNNKSCFSASPPLPN